MWQRRPLGTFSPIFSQSRGQVEPQSQTPAKGDVEPKSHTVPSNCWCDSWKAVNRKGSEAEQGQWASSKWRARDSEHVTAGL